MQQATVTIDGKQWSVDVATTPAEIAQGLSGLASIPANTGMLFDLGSDLSSIIIDMSQMLFNLDIVFINSSGEVVGVLVNVVPGDSVTFSLDIGARYFLEVNADEADDIELGESAQFTGYTPPTPFDIGTIINLMITVMIVVMMMKMVGGQMATVAR